MTKPAKEQTRSKKRTVKKTDSGQVVVGSEVGVTIPVGDTTAHLRFSFWHERLAKSDSQAEIKRVANLVDEFNEEEVDRRVEKYRKVIKRILQEDDDEEPRGSTVQDRARKKMGKRK